MKRGWNLAAVVAAALGASLVVAPAGASPISTMLEYDSTSQFSSATAQAHFGSVRLSDVGKPVRFTQTTVNGVTSAYVRFPALKTTTARYGFATWTASDLGDLLLVRNNDPSTSIDVSFGYDMNGNWVTQVTNKWGIAGCTVAVSRATAAASVSCRLPHTSYADAWEDPSISVLDNQNGKAGDFYSPLVGVVIG